MKAFMLWLVCCAVAACCITEPVFECRDYTIHTNPETGAVDSVTHVVREVDDPDDCFELEDHYQYPPPVVGSCKDGVCRDTLLPWP